MATCMGLFDQRCGFIFHKTFCFLKISSSLIFLGFFLLYAAASQRAWATDSGAPQPLPSPPPGQTPPAPAPAAPSPASAAPKGEGTQGPLKPPFTAIPRYVSLSDITGTVLYVPQEDASEKKTTAPASGSLASQHPQGACCGGKVLHLGDQVKVQDTLGAYRIIFLLGSWNPRSEYLLRKQQSNIWRLRRRGISVWGVFLQDNAAAVKQWCEALKPKFPVVLADPEVTKTFDGKGIPSVFVTDANNHLVMRQEEPTDAELSALFARLYQWTDF